MEYPWLMHGDCLERMKEIPDGCVDMILADLPYGTTDCKWDVIIPFEPLWEQYWRVLKITGVVALFGSEPFSSRLRLSQIQHYKYDWIWDKKIPSGMSYAKFQPMRQHELISLFYKKANYTPQKTKRDIPIKSGGQKNLTSQQNQLDTYKIEGFKRVYAEKNPTTIIAFDKIRKGSLHPTQKPVPLLEYLIKTYTNEGEFVLDNVMGSGSTGVACINTGRKFIGIEKDEKYFQIARERISDAILEKEDIF